MTGLLGVLGVLLDPPNSEKPLPLGLFLLLLEVLGVKESLQLSNASRQLLGEAAP